MHKTIIAFGASNSIHSINKKFAVFAGEQLEKVNVKILDLNDFELPIYSVDLQNKEGVPSAAIAFLEEIKKADGIVISVAEYNGLHTAAFKNLWDWMSRIENMQIWNGKPMLLLSTSPSRRAENNVLRVSKELFPHFGARIISSFYLPSFHHFFKDNEIIEPEYQQKFIEALQKFQNHIIN